MKPSQWMMSGQTAPRRRCVAPSPELAVGPEQRVDAVDDPVEEAAVQSLAHGVPHLRRLLHRVGSHDGLAPGHHAVGGQGFLELVGADAQQGCH